MGVTARVHPTDEMLRAYGLGQLDHSSADSVSKHVDGCADCQQRISNLSSDSFVARLQAARPDAGPTAPIGSSLAGLSRMNQASSSANRPSSSSLPPGLADHPDYEVVRELGQGGMGTVYLALNRLMGRHEVLKVVSSHLMNRRGVLDRFLTEIRNAARLHHANIVTAFSASRSGDSIIFAMEYVQGLDLAQLVKTKGALPIPHACNFIHQAALGLQHAYEQGMVHRDVKPSNLMLASQGGRAVIKVLDFGLAKIQSEGAVNDGLTHEGQMLGTPDYIAPEQITDARNADTRADIYSLGCTLHYLLTGRPPFRASSLYELLQAHHSMDATPLNFTRPEVPIELAAIVAKMMAKEPDRRFQAPVEVARALAPYFKKPAVTTRDRQAEFSQADQPAARPQPPTSKSIPAHPPQPSPAPSTPPPLPRPDSEHHSQPASDHLVQLPAPQPLSSTASSVINGKPPWLRPAALSALFILALALAFAVTLRVKTRNGTIELVNLPADATVLVDGEKVEVTWPAGGKPATISVTPGSHKIVYKKDEFELSGDQVTIKAGSSETLTVRLAAENAPAPTREQPAAISESTGGKTTPPHSTTAEKSPIPPTSIQSSIGITLNLIPAGEFLMGSPEHEPQAYPHEKPQHLVRISKPFYLATTEVTQSEYQLVTANNPSYFSPTGAGASKIDGQPTGRLPVEQVSWIDAVEFCNALSTKDRLEPFYLIDGQKVKIPDPTAPGYRLPTEAEWEFACRAGSSTNFSFGDDPARLADFAWFQANSIGRTHPVGQKRPNNFGLYDMHGNVWEWCFDWFGHLYYHETGSLDPIGLMNGKDRVLRGGAWNEQPRDCRSPDRGWRPVTNQSEIRGFRIARNQPTAFASDTTVTPTRTLKNQETRPRPKTDLDRIATGTWLPLVNATTPLRDPKKIGFENGVLRLDSTTIVFSEINAHDVILKAKVLKRSGQNVTIGVRFGVNSNVAHGYGAWYNGAADGGDFFGIGTYGKQWHNLSTVHVGASSKPDGFSEMALAAIGDTVTLYVNGTCVTANVNRDVVRGSLRIGTLKGRGLFKDVQYQILDPAPRNNRK